jgi:sugar (pentulose or hexulose) kinase
VEWSRLPRDYENMINVIAIFDIGKTNKKFFLFDSNFKEVYREYTSFDILRDEDGYATENLPALKIWLKEVFDRILEETDYNIKAVNFSAYGASLIHLDENGEVLTPLYDYTKPMGMGLISDFYLNYGPEKEFASVTGSLNSGMLNSGMQLYWLKRKRPDVFKKIKYSLHLPQYISYIFTGIPLSEYTSIGCHTALWDYRKKDYHHWVYKEGIHEKFPPIVPTETSLEIEYRGKCLKMGIGIHDSSAALLPYIRSTKKKFILVSTGTWSIAFNPFVNRSLTAEEVEKQCINYMRINGKPIKSTRIFLGSVYSRVVKEISEYYKVSSDYHTSVTFQKKLYSKIMLRFDPIFIKANKGSMDLMVLNFEKLNYKTFEEAYHQLMIELVLIQVESIHIAVGDLDVSKIFVDGGFSDNDIFIKLLSSYLSNMELRTTDSSLGSALGAAIAISDTKINSKFLKKNYSLKEHVPFFLKNTL